MLNDVRRSSFRMKEANGRMVLPPSWKEGRKEKKKVGHSLTSIKGRWLPFGHYPHTYVYVERGR